MGPIRTINITTKTVTETLVEGLNLDDAGNLRQSQVSMIGIQ